MKHVKLLDCTLRDGAYLVDKKFGNNVIKGIIEGLTKSKIDCVEIGFFQDDGFGDGKTVFRNSSDAKRFIPKDKNGTIFTVLADFSRFSMENLDDCDIESVDAVRECFFKNERYDAINACKIIKQKGYKLFVQPVDVLGYTDDELVEFIKLINEVEPYSFSIVDTFGSMYLEDLRRVFEIVDKNLIKSCKIGFHSHNNMQMSSALSQEFTRLSAGKREVVIDGTISGMGRGAGNTPTELIAQYLNTHWHYDYDMDTLLDVIDDYMDNLRTRCTWGYSTSYFIAGCYGAHVNNIAYLTQKSSIRSKSIRYILNKIGEIPRKRYDYDLLEKTYLEYLCTNVSDDKGMNYLMSVLEKKDILVLAPGSTILSEEDKIEEYIKKVSPIVISVGFIPDKIKCDYIFISNVRRYATIKDNLDFQKMNKIITSNIKQEKFDDSENIISFINLVVPGNEHIDNSTILLLHLLDSLNVNSIGIAGLDGYNSLPNNYVNSDLELSNVLCNSEDTNRLISKMLLDYLSNRKHFFDIRFVTTSRFKDVIN